VTATVTALDANRVALPNAAVALSVDAGGVLTVGSSVTDTAGRLTATVGIGSDTTNRDITVTARAGSLSRTAVLKVVNSATGNTPTAIEVLTVAPAAGTGGDPVQIRAFVKDVNNNALPATPISFTASTGTLSSVSSVTDSTGLATAQFTAGADRSNRSATITVTSGAITQTLTLPIEGTRLAISGPSSLILGNSAVFDVVVSDSKGNPVPGVSIAASSTIGNAVTAVSSAVSNSTGQVRFNYTASNAGADALQFNGAGAVQRVTPSLTVSGEDFAFVSPAPSSTINVGVVAPVQVRLRSGGAPLAGRTVLFATTGGSLSAASGVTAADGVATVNLSSASAGPVIVQATVQGSATSTTLPLLVVATTPTNLVLQASPTALAPNPIGSSTNQAQVMARVTDAAGNPVQGQTVNFTRIADPSGGNLLQASATTDASGQASVAYRAGSQSTSDGGVALRATVAGTAVTGTTTLTVNQTALFIALGTGNVITNLDPQTYQKDWVAYVTDSNGIPVNGVTLTIKGIPTHYLTGRLRWNGSVWGYSGPIHLCRNEDANRNGVLDAGEDDNGDGRLWPGNVIAVTPGSVLTTVGRATLSLIYAESYAPWVQMDLTTSATVSGTESGTTVNFVVSGEAGDFSNQNVPPAGVVSPFGEFPSPTALARGGCLLLP
jgi:5-hydroxyisourate hydrolase-like protein (transthyretin family)